MLYFEHKYQDMPLYMYDSHVAVQRDQHVRLQEAVDLLPAPTASLHSTNWRLG